METPPQVWPGVPCVDRPVYLGGVGKEWRHLVSIHAQEDRAEAKKKSAFVVERLQQMKLKNAALLVAEGIEDAETLEEILRST